MKRFIPKNEHSVYASLFFQALLAVRKEPPPYGARSGFVPRTIHDFGDGGAFPEIHVAQFPLGPTCILQQRLEMDPLRQNKKINLHYILKRWHFIESKFPLVHEYQNFP